MSTKTHTNTNTNTNANTNTNTKTSQVTACFNLAVSKKLLLLGLSSYRKRVRATYHPNAKIVMTVKGSQTTLSAEAAGRDNRLWLAYLEPLISGDQTPLLVRLDTASVAQPPQIAPTVAREGKKHNKRCWALALTLTLLAPALTLALASVVHNPPKIARVARQGKAR